MICRCWNHLIILIYICSLSVSSKSHKKEAERDLVRNIHSFDRKIERLGELDRSGHFLDNDFARAEDALKGRGNVGVVIEVDNFSQFRLDDQHHYVYAGHADKHLTKKKSIGPQHRDIVLFHNYADGLARSSAGSVSWQVKNDDGTPYMLAGLKNRGIRIALTWSVWYKRCGKGVQNEVTVHFIHNYINEKGNWKLPSEDQSYHYKHKNPSSLTWKRDAPNMEVKASIGEGCKPKLLLQFYSAGSKQNRILKNGVNRDNFSLTWILIYIGIGLAAVFIVLYITKVILQNTRPKKEYKSELPESDTDNE